MQNFLSSIFLSIFIFSCVAVPELSEELVDEDSQEEMICKSEKVMGSRIPETNCYTKEELIRLEENSKKMLEKERSRRDRMKTLGNLKPE